MLSWFSRPTVSFLAKIFAICGAWFVLYDVILLPDGRLDEFISIKVAHFSGGVLDTGGLSPFVDDRDIILPNTNGVRIADGCNGLAAIGLFIGFVMAYPGSWSRRAWFIPLGIVLVFVANLFRVVALVLAQAYWPAMFEPLHAIGMTTIFYVVIFALWVAWIQLGGSFPNQSAT